VPMPSDPSLIIRPDSISPSLWEQLLREHNPSQLFAIRYVVEVQRQEEIKQDTQITLVQGPPGRTGRLTSYWLRL
jgi:hypothetical protein